MAIYVYRLSDGVLMSWAPGDDAQVADDQDLADHGMAVVRELPALDDTHAWDVENRTIVTVTAPIKPNYIISSNYVQLFTGDEIVAIDASTEPRVARYRLTLSVSQQFDLNSPALKTELDYMASIGLLASERVDQIIAGQAQAA